MSERNQQHLETGASTLTLSNATARKGARASPSNGPSSSITIEKSVEELNRAYLPIANLLAEMDQQLSEFSEKMNGILLTVPAHDSLSALWEEQGQAWKMSSDDTPSTSTVAKDKTEASTMNKRRKHENNNTHILEVETEEDPDDRLLFI